MDNDRINKIKPPEASIEKDGAILLKGYFSFKNSSGVVEEKEQEIYICRCGQSRNKPFCDDSHKNK